MKEGEPRGDEEPILKGPPSPARPEGEDSIQEHCIVVGPVLTDEQFEELQAIIGEIDNPNPLEEQT